MSKFKVGDRVRSTDSEGLHEAIRNRFGTVVSVFGEEWAGVKFGDLNETAFHTRLLTLVDYRIPYQNAIDCQMACNLSGVAKSLARDLDTIWDEERVMGGAGTGWVNTHPAVQLYVAKLIELCQMGVAEQDAYSKAYMDCKLKCQP